MPGRTGGERFHGARTFTSRERALRTRGTLRASHSQLSQLVSTGAADGLEGLLPEIDGAAAEARAEGSISSWGSMTAVASAASAYITAVLMDRDAHVRVQP